MTILILLETKNDIRDNIKKNLEWLGYNVTFYPENTFTPYKLKFSDKILNILFKILGIENKILTRKKKRYHHTYLNKTYDDIKVMENFANCIVFRPDLYSDDLLKLFKEKSEKLVAYQWDGMNRYPSVFSKMKFFDDFFCFNPSDCNSTIKFISNFYFDYKKITPVKEIHDLSYIGYFYDERFTLLEEIAKHLPNKNLNFNLYSFNRKSREKIELSSFINNIKQPYSYNELLQIHNQSKMILDIKHSTHNGLSFRFFEAMLLEKKIITTNPEAEKYDFYNQNNIFILKDGNFDELKNFIAKPYIQLDDSIIKKYSFSNWLKNILSLENKILIDLPY